MHDKYTSLVFQVTLKSSILYGCHLLRRLYNIHLLHAGEGNMKIYSPKSFIFPKGNARREYDTRGWINFHISCTRML